MVAPVHAETIRSQEHQSSAITTIPDRHECCLSSRIAMELACRDTDLGVHQIRFKHGHQFLGAVDRVRDESIVDLVKIAPNDRVD
jgi:hypothetical protein